MYKFDVAINIRNIDWEVFGKNDVFFDRSSCFRYCQSCSGKKGYSYRRLFHSKIRTGSFSKEFRCCRAMNKFRTSSLPRIFQLFNRTLPLTGNYRNLPFSSLMIKKDAIIFTGSKKMGLFFSIKKQTASMCQTKRHRHIYNKTLNFGCVPLLPTEQLFLLVEIVPFGAHRILRKKHTSRHLFYRTSTEHLPVAGFEIY